MQPRIRRISPLDSAPSPQLPWTTRVVTQFACANCAPGPWDVGTQSEAPPTTPLDPRLCT
jgi:hypothetical protein